MVRWVTLDRVSERRRGVWATWGGGACRDSRAAKWAWAGKKGGQIFNKVLLGWDTIKKKL